MIAGLTGGIGCGKSSVLKIFSEMGWVTIDSDKICRELYENKDPRLLSAIRAEWPESIGAENTIDRKKIAENVFNDKVKLELLNSILHPLIKEDADKIINANKEKNIIFDVPLLFEKGRDDLFDVVIAVWTDSKTQYERLNKRGMTNLEIDRRIANQLSSREKLERADYGIINRAGLDALKEQCEKLEKLIRI
jgi:dephospho-CoA kinase